MLFETVKPLIVVAGLGEQLSILPESNREELKAVQESSISANILEFFINKTKVSTWDSQKSFTVASLGNKVDGETTAAFYDGSNHGASLPFVWPKKHVPSLLSPRSKTSDLYPDGIISLSWILKYQEKYPSAIILFHYLYESSEKDPLGAHGSTGLKRDQDEISASTINSYKMHADVCGLKLVVCFLLKRSQSSIKFLNR